MKICIYGAGAGGGHFAVRLAAAGHDVCVIARGAHLAAIQERGLRLHLGSQVLDAKVFATEDPAQLGAQDLVIVSVKATALAPVAEAIAPLVARETSVIFPQNGMTWWYRDGLPAACPAPPDIPIFALSPRFRASLRPEQIVGGIIYSANEIEAPGVIRNTSPGYNRLDLGSITGLVTAELVKLRAEFEKAGIASPAVADIRSAVWTKLVTNMSGSTIALVSRSQSSISRRDPALREIFFKLVAEGMTIAAAHGFPLELNPDVLLSRLMDHKPSLLQDYEQLRPMEVAEIILAPSRVRRAQRISCPTLDVFAALAVRMARDRGLAR